MPWILACVIYYDSNLYNQINDISERRVDAGAGSGSTSFQALCPACPEQQQPIKDLHISPDAIKLILNKLNDVLPTGFRIWRLHGAELGEICGGE